MRTFFTPAALLPPALPKAEAGLKGYIEYISTWDLYVSHLKSAQALWKQDKKDTAALVKAAAKRGCVVKTAFKLKPTDQTKREVNEKGALVDRTVRVNVVKKVTEEVPQAVPVPKSPEAKAATRHAKRMRYRKNLQLRKAKKLAELSLWQVRTKTNLDKLGSKTVAPAKSKPQPKPGPSLQSLARRLMTSSNDLPPKSEGSKAKVSEAQTGAKFTSAVDYRTWAHARMREVIATNIDTTVLWNQLRKLNWEDKKTRAEAMDLIEQKRYSIFVNTPLASSTVTRS